VSSVQWTMFSKQGSESGHDLFYCRLRSRLRPRVRPRTCGAGRPGRKSSFGSGRNVVAPGRAARNVIGRDVFGRAFVASSGACGCVPDSGARAAPRSAGRGVS
jgi:hypothetical protein